MNKAKVLIVKNESILALEMKKTLDNLGFEVTNTASNFNNALNSVRINKPDIILMDLNLENSKDGIETTKKIHSIDKIPVIYVTDYIDEKTIKRANKISPVNYLIKPFKKDELKSNILVGLHKNESINDIYQHEENFHIGLGYNYNYESEKLFYKNILIELNKKEKLLLKLLIKAKGELVSFKNLETQLWPFNSVSENTLRTLIYRLKAKLEHKLIETKPLIGCRLLLKN